MALFWMPATWGEGGTGSKNHLPIAAQEAEVFKGEFQVARMEGGGRMAHSYLRISGNSDRQL